MITRRWSPLALASALAANMLTACAPMTLVGFGVQSRYVIPNTNADILPLFTQVRGTASVTSLMSEPERTDLLEREAIDNALGPFGDGHMLVNYSILEKRNTYLLLRRLQVVVQGEVVRVKEFGKPRRTVRQAEPTLSPTPTPRDSSAAPRRGATRKGRS